VWDLRGQRPSFVALEGHQDPVYSAAFSVDGTHVVTASQDNTARVWDLHGERPSFVALEGHQGWVRSASFSPDGTHVVTASYDGTARAWRMFWDVNALIGIVRAGLSRCPYPGPA
jgi:WD40 repeat protein